MAFHRAALLCALLQHAAGFVLPGAFAPAHPVGKVQLSAPALRRTGNEGAVVQRASRRMMTPPMAVGVRPSQMTDATKGGGKSVLVFSWFYAAPKELELVKRIYKKKGFSKVVVQESIVKEIATPRGWYRTYEKFTGGAELDKELQATLGQEFDVVHCMSGGFLNLALALTSSIPVRFKVLVLDSTPIMPQPKAFVRFARAYMKDHGLDVITKLLPEPLHTAFYTSRWGLGGGYVRLKHKVMQLTGIKGKRRIGDMPYEEMEKWTRWATHVAMLDRYDNMTQVTIDTVLDKQASGVEECIFLYNPTDPYINPDDVNTVINHCPDAGVEATIVHVGTKHIETLFRKPNVLFNAIDAALERVSGAPAAAK